ncbi:MAG: transposase domain-containing protein [Firmicutes bacterium]|nr:transposase domain-containing protein [Bacillota bacterium]
MTFSESGRWPKTLPRKPSLSCTTVRPGKLNPFKYLVYLFEKLPDVDIKNPAVLDEFMPWSDELPTECRLEK